MKLIDDALLLDLIAQVRQRMPRIGGRKLFYLLQPHLLQNDINMGRDGLFSFMREHQLLIKPRRRYCHTTDSKHWLRKYPNMLKELAPTGREQVLVSDITYIATDEGFAYLFLITDGFSRKILGHHTSENMRANSALIALKMALRAVKHTNGIIHHSDRGVQYCSEEYVAVLAKKHALISMTEASSPTQNAIAERVNGILKTEWIYHQKQYKNTASASLEISKIIAIYNNERPHDSLGKMTPSKAHELDLCGTKLWRKRLYAARPEIGRKAHPAGDLAGIGCSKCRPPNDDGHPSFEWPSCDIRHSPMAIPRTSKSPQARPALHQGTSNVLLEIPKSQIHLQTT